MGATVDPIDDEVAPIIELVGKAFGGDASNDRGAGSFGPDDVEVPPLIRERPLPRTRAASDRARRRAAASRSHRR
jgi:hypothetical protein